MYLQVWNYYSYGKLVYERLGGTCQGRTALRHWLQLEALVAAHVHCDLQMQEGPVTGMLPLQIITFTCRTIKTENRLESRFATPHC